MKKLFLFTTLFMLITAAVLPVMGCNSKKNNNNSSLLFILGHPVTNITLNKNSTTIPVGSTEQLTATIAPANAANQKVSWSSNDQTVATVSSTGIVTAKVVGTAEISVTTHDGDYSAICTVTVSAVVTIPGYATVTTEIITAIDGTTATGGGDVTDAGSTGITARGICWSTSPNPTIIALHTTNGSTTGSYTSNLTGLTIDTIYYVRAYAINGGGTAYGNEVFFNTGKTFGSTYGGGLVFYNDGNGGGLVAATADQSSGVQWYNGSNVLTSATGFLVGTGQANTSAIVTVQGGGTYAAETCDVLVQYGHSDWFLPSQNELNLMYVNLHQRGWGTFANNNYWTSTEVSSTNANAQSFIIGTQSTQLKSQTYYVRAIRAF